MVYQSLVIETISKQKRKPIVNLKNEPMLISLKKRVLLFWYWVTLFIFNKKISNNKQENTWNNTLLAQFEIH